MKSCTLWVLTIALMAGARIISGQVVTGVIFGTVGDSSGAVIQQVKVSAKNTETGIVRAATTDSSGSYQILSVPAGSYDVEVAVSGFKTEVRTGIKVTVGESVGVNFELAVGEVQQRVEVEAVPTQVETTNASLGGVVGETAVRELPLNGRDWLQLVTLQPGVVGAIGQQSSSSYSNSRAARGNGQSLSISGSRPPATYFSSTAWS